MIRYLIINTIDEAGVKTPLSALMFHREIEQEAFTKVANEYTRRLNEIIALVNRQYDTGFNVDYSIEIMTDTEYYNRVEHLTGINALIGSIKKQAQKASELSNYQKMKNTQELERKIRDFKTWAGYAAKTARSVAA